MSTLLARRTLLATRSRPTVLLSKQHLLLPSRQLHVRPISILGTATRVTARLAGRGAIAVGIGAGAGLGTLSYAENKFQGAKEGALSLFNTASDSFSSLSSSLSDSLSSASSSLSSSAKDISSSASELWTETTLSLEDQMEVLRKRWAEFRASNASEEGGEGGEGGDGGEGKKERPYKKSPPTATSIALASSLPLVVDSDPEEGTTEMTGDATGDLMLLTRKLIEIRSILLSLNEGGNGSSMEGDSSLQLPSIVVIGSQSSGKSSVLEAIVGREFLPKGNNMVTRRPIELTLIHTPPTSSNPSPSTFAEFPNSYETGHLTDFSKVQQHLLDLNLSVPAAECVSDSPIHLRIHSPHVPDLSLVDLPGYVQISSLDQPEELKEKIASLCDKYIKGPNIILAVCSADVDLANSPALKAAKRVDPLGMRTIGVVTKMDLVEPEIGGSILRNDRYPLALGYVGVICKTSSASKGRSLIKRESRDEGSPLARAIKEQEEHFFGDNGSHFSKEGIKVGTETLKNRLMVVLEESMSNSLSGIANTVALELEEATYQFKVQYNDRNITAESYVAETMDLLKSRIGELSKGFNKSEVRRLLKSDIDEQCLDLLAKEYWSNTNRPTSELNKLGENSKLKTDEDLDSYWIRELDFVCSKLTKSGIGRHSTQLVVDSIREQLSSLGSTEPLSYHEESKERINSTADNILRKLFTLTSAQVENSVKPFKYEIEVNSQEWEQGRVRSIALLERELSMCEKALGRIRDVVGSRKLRGAMEYVGEVEEKERRRKERMREMRAKQLAAGGTAQQEEDPMVIQKGNEEDVNTPSYNSALLTRAREAMFLSSRSSILKLRLMALKSKRCKGGPEQKAFCPEAFLNVVADKLSYTAVQFINIELLVEFFSQFPRDIDSRLGYDLDPAEVKKFAKENPVIRNHLALQERKEKLELVADKLDDLVKLQREKAAKDPLRKDTTSRRGLFTGLF